MVLLAVAGTVVWWGGSKEVGVVGPLMVAAVVILYTVIARRGDTVVADRDGLVVTTRGHPVHYRWTEMLEIGWVGPNWPYTGAGIVVRPTAGGPWDTPGPNNPTQVATLPVFGRAGHRHARSILGEQCRLHGIPFDENGRRLLMNGPPGSAYRKAPRP